LIKVQDLCKNYQDKKRGLIKAVDHVSFTCRPGEIYGLLGPNGAGKTTTLRLLSTVLTPDSGTASVAGYDIVSQPGQVRGAIGFLSGDTGLYRRLTGREILRYFGSLYGLDKHLLDNRIQSLANVLQMEEYLDAKTDKLSTGQKQRISIARTVVHDPPVLILDEPTSGLDILASRSIMEFILQARSNGKTIIFSTHVMREAERLCDHIGIIHQGRMWAEGTQAELRKHYQSEDLEAVFVRAVNLEPLPALQA
jgi:sodium transport system ATP-binding protein